MKQLLYTTLMVSLIACGPRKEEQAQALWQDYTATRYEAPPVWEDIAGEKQWETIAEAYQQGDYVAAAGELELYMNSALKPYIGTFMYIGLCHLYSGKYERAIPYLEMEAFDVDSPYRDDAEWNLMLTHHLSGDTDAVLESLEEIGQQNGHKWQEQANALFELIRPEK